MEARELRIGNIIADKLGRVGNVLRFTHLACITKLEFSTLSCDIELMEPVLLTEDWLLKFGFITLDCETDYIEWGLDDNKNGAEFHVWSNGTYQPLPIFITYNLGLWDVEKEIKYVHQLQNLYFALTGEELTIIK